MSRAAQPGVFATRALRPAAGEQGLALLVVLWMMTILTVLVGQFCYSMRAEMNITRNFRDSAIAHYQARAGIEQGLLWLLESDQAPGTGEPSPGEVQWRINQANPAGELAEGSFTVWIGNESGLINLNLAHADLLTLLLGDLDLAEETGKTIVDSIQDWRDSDDLHRLHGAEKDYYERLPDPYRPTDGPFRSVDELLLVRGMTPEIFAAIRDRLTIYPQRMAAPPEEEQKGWQRPKKKKILMEQKQININSAPPAVLAALPQMSEEAIAAIVAFRLDGDFTAMAEVRQTVGDEVYPHISRYISMENLSYYTITATGRAEDGGAVQIITAVVDVDPRQDTYRIVQWLDSPSGWR